MKLFKRMLSILMTVLLLVSVTLVGTLPVAAATNPSMTYSPETIEHGATGDLTITITGLTPGAYYTIRRKNPLELVGTTYRYEYDGAYGITADASGNASATIASVGNLAVGTYTFIVFDNWDFVTSGSFSFKKDFTVTGEPPAITGSCGNNLTYHFEPTTGTLTITGTGAMTSYSSTSTPWYAYRTLIQSVSLPENMTTIGDYAFYGCTGLTEITIPSSITSIGHYAFYGCTGLTEITIPSNVKSIGSSAFYNCTNLKTVENYSNLIIAKGGTGYGYTGYYADMVNWYATPTGSCGDNLTWKFEPATGALSIAGTGAMTNYANASAAPWYAYRTLIQSVNFSEGLTTIGDYAFYKYYDGLTEITIPDSVTSIGDYAFSECANLATVTVGKAVNTIENCAFYLCLKLKTVENYSALPITKGVADYGFIADYAQTVNWYITTNGTCGDNLTYCFEPTTGNLTITGTGEMTNYTSSSPAPWYAYRDLIQSVSLPQGLTTVGSKAFSNCTNLKTVENYSPLYILKGSSDYGYVGYYADTVNWYGTVSGSCGETLMYCFEATTGALTITGTGKMTDCFTSLAPWYDYRDLIQSVSLPKGLTAIGTYAFYNCINLKTVENHSLLPITKGSTGYGHAGYYADTVNWYGSGSCGDNLTWSFDSTTGILAIIGTGAITDYAKASAVPWYAYRDLIQSVSLPKDLTAIGDYAFYGCTGLTEITIPSSITSIGYDAFYDCSNLKTVENYSNLYIQKGISTHGSVGYYADTVNWYATLITGSCGDNLTWKFEPATGALTITGTGKMTNYTRYSVVPWYAYRNLIQSVSLPEGLTAISDYAFYQCYCLTSVTIPNGVTSIGQYAFAMYTFETSDWAFSGGLTEIGIPDSVTTLGKSAFYGCENLKTVTLGKGLTYIAGIGGEAYNEGAFTQCTNLKTVENYSNLYIQKGGKEHGGVGYYADTVNWYATPTGSCGDNLTWKFEPATGALSIAGTGAMTDYANASAAPWYAYRTLIQSVSFAKGLTTIGDYAFYKYYDGLTEITIPDSVTSIGDYAFSECANLATVTVGKAVNTIENCAFYLCLKLKTVENYSALPITKGVADYGFIADYAQTVNWYRNTPAAPAVPIATIRAATSFKVKTYAGYEYRIEGGAWQSSPTFTGLKPGTTYKVYQRIAQTSTQGASDASPALAITTRQRGPAAPAAPVATIRAATSFKVKTYAGYEYKIEGGQWQTSAKFTGLKPGTTYKVYQRVAQTATHNPSDPSPALVITTRQRGPAAPAAPVATIRAATSFKVKTYAGYEYKIEGGQWQTSATFTGLTPNTTYKIYQRVAQTATHNPSDASPALVITTRQRGPAAPAAPVATIRTTTSIKVKTVAGYEYRIGNGNWQTSATFTGLTPNTTYKIYQRVAQTDTRNPSDSSPALTVKTK